MNDDLESQRRALRPDSGMLTANGSGNEALQGDLRAFASRPECARFARTIETATNLNGRYFTRRTNLEAARIGLIEEGEKLGLWRQEDGKEYWKHTHLTWKWIRTSIALDDERRRHEQARAGGSPPG